MQLQRIDQEGKKVLGINWQKFEEFPILVKFIDAKDNLSIQVYPDNEYALKIAEIQQNSNVTYRVYDFGRVGKDGKKRELHIDKAVEVTNRVPISRKNTCYPHIASCDYFTVDCLNMYDEAILCIQDSLIFFKVVASFLK